MHTVLPVSIGNGEIVPANGETEMLMDGISDDFVPIVHHVFIAPYSVKLIIALV